MELKTTDLMLRDYVLYHAHGLNSDGTKWNEDVIVSIYQIDRNTVDVKFEDGELEYYVPIEQIDAIPVSHEFMILNGFSENVAYATYHIDEHIWLEYYYYEHRLRRYSKIRDEWDNDSKERNILYQNNVYYVHEMQHALRELYFKENKETIKI